MPHAQTRVAAQLYTVRDFTKSAADTAQTLKRLRQIGYAYAEISAIGSIPPQEMKAMLDDAGVIPIGYHTGLKELREQFQALVDRLHLLNINYVTVAYMPEEERATEAAYKARAREMSDLGKRLAAENIHLQYHNHAFEFRKFGGKTGLDILYEESDPRHLMAEIDTCWVARGGADPAAWILKMQGRMDQIHLKDTVMSATEPVFAEVGEGNLNWPAIVKACRAIGVKDFIVEQDSCPATQDPFKSLEISLKNLSAMGIT